MREDDTGTGRTENGTRPKKSLRRCDERPPMADEAVAELQAGHEKRRRVTLDLSQKVAAARWMDQQPGKVRRKRLVDWIQEQFDVTVSEKAAGNLRSHAAELLEKGETAGAYELGRKRARKGTRPELERRLDAWFQDIGSQGAALTDAAIVDKAKEICSQLSNAKGGPAVLRGRQWLYNFKSRHGIGVTAFDGEAGQAAGEFMAGPSMQPSPLLNVSPQMGGRDGGAGRTLVTLERNRNDMHVQSELATAIEKANAVRSLISELRQVLDVTEMDVLLPELAALGVNRETIAKLREATCKRLLGPVHRR